MTKAQETLWNKIQETLNEMKDSDYVLNVYNEEFSDNRFYPTFEEFAKSNIGIFLQEKHQKAVESNIVFIKSNSKTLKALEKEGLIQIMEIGGSFSDYVKVLR